MTVAELIARLSKLDPDLPVLVNGYEGGSCDLRAERIQVGRYARDCNIRSVDAAYRGPHEFIPAKGAPSQRASNVRHDPAVLLGRDTDADGTPEY